METAQGAGDIETPLMETAQGAGDIETPLMETAKRGSDTKSDIGQFAQINQEIYKPVWWRLVFVFGSTYPISILIIKAAICLNVIGTLKI